jgi:hypothetical protein
MVMAARMPMITITTRSSTMVKAELVDGRWYLVGGGVGLFFMRERERERV